MSIRLCLCAAVLLVACIALSEAQVFSKGNFPVTKNSMDTVAYNKPSSQESLSTSQGFFLPNKNQDPALKLTKAAVKRKRKVAFVKKNLRVANVAEYKKVKAMHKKVQKTDQMRQEYAHRMESLRARMIKEQQKSGKTPQVNADIINYVPPAGVQVANAIMPANPTQNNKNNNNNGVTQMAKSNAKNKIALVEAQAGARDVGINCPQVEGRSVNTYFTMAKLCVLLSSAAYNIGSGANAPRENSPLRLADGRNFTVHKVVIPPQDESNYGLGKYNGPYMIVSDATNIYVVFRGSYSLQDWLDDFTATFTQLAINGEQFGFVHTGFYNLWKAQNIIPTLQLVTRRFPNKKIIITGHSLGGAVATLTALEVALIYGINPQLYTYGSPRVGDLTFAHNLRALATHLRFKNKEDLVPTVPAFYTPVFPPFPTSEETKPRLFYHADDAAIKMWGPTSSPRFECIEDVTPWDPALPNPLNHVMAPNGYIDSVNALN